MELPIPSKLEKLWDTWDIPTCVLLNLFLQVFLVLFASFRQRSQNSFLHFLIWSAYLSADWIAAVTVGLITKVLTDDPFQPPFQPHHVNRDLYALWASFLLLHLGGPDTITSFALEDNELWPRHLFGLILQVMGAAYCIFLTLPNNNLWLPTFLVFVVGSVKYAERTMALYLASLDHFQGTVPEPEDSDFDFKPDLASESSNHIELLMVSYSLFKSFKGIIFGNPPSSRVVKSSRMLFLEIIKNPNVGFKLIEYELSFMYEVFHTKVAEVRSRIGLVFRLSSFCFIVGAFISFCFVVKDGNHEFGGFDMSLTYALLIGAVVLDTISGIKLMIFSDWILVSNNGLIKRWRKFIPECVLKRRRWCGSVSQYNMIDYCLGERWIWKCKFPDCFRVIIDNIKFMLFSSSMNNIEDLKCFVFENREALATPLLELDEFKYRLEVLKLHLLTEIGYHGTQTESSEYTGEKKTSRRICKVISDYMFYLLSMKPELRLGPSVNWQRTFQNTFEEAKGYLMKYKISDHIKACNKLIDYKDRSQTVLYDACLSARQLKMENEYSWKDLSHAWLNVLRVGSLWNRPILNAEQASKGGELLTFIWFLHHHLHEIEYDVEDLRADASICDNRTANVLEYFGWTKSISRSNS